MRSYLSGRIVRSGIVAQRSTMSVPQGSVMGQELWNIPYNGVFHDFEGEIVLYEKSVESI